MSRLVKLAISAALAFALGLGANAFADETPAPDVMFKLAKGAWRTRVDAPFVTFSLRERYTWRGHVHDNWWTAYYRDADRNLVLHRMIVPKDEAQRLHGFPIGINLRFHGGSAKADSLDTSADADAFPILDPLIDPNGSFGLLASSSHAALVGLRAPSPAPSPLQLPSPIPTSPVTQTPTEKPLRELARVEAVARDYAIAYSGTDRVGEADAYHLTLTPLRDPNVNRLRDLWIDPATYATLQLSVQGLFEGKPYDSARWVVDYIPLAGHYYIRDIRADDALRFGMDRTVSDLRYDFVSYDFPATIPDLMFRRLL